MTKEFQGAEATVTIKEKVEKDRERKKYRHPDIDEKIRTERTIQETRLMEKAQKYGVKTPEILSQEEKKFKMQKINGKQLKEIIEQQPGTIEKMAEQVALLHSADIIHGDLTTSNAIYNDEKYI